ncbi:MAG TPA: hypothetical protein VLA61_23020 [Ideonella sp.]|uniref:hypothetical protein n=1 Tax=Ideonella sp. TaxID=1929293 RepID=UPI002B6E8A17|nr:hypothetical protein [Ideonella sp.]HSI51146.1 hypothetical protein [Ideonella sp.]
MDGVFGGDLRLQGLRGLRVCREKGLDCQLGQRDVHRRAENLGGADAGRSRLACQRDGPACRAAAGRGGVLGLGQGFLALQAVTTLLLADLLAWALWRSR